MSCQFALLLCLKALLSCWYVVLRFQNYFVSCLSIDCVMIVLKIKTILLRKLMPTSDKKIS